METYENPKYFFRMPVRFFLTGQFLNAVAWNSDIKLLLHHFPPNPMNNTLVIIRVILITKYTSILSGNHMQTMKQTHWKCGMFTYSAWLWNWNGMPPICGWSLLALESRRTSAPSHAASRPMPVVGLQDIAPVAQWMKPGKKS